MLEPVRPQMPYRALLILAAVVSGGVLIATSPLDHVRVAGAHPRAPTPTPTSVPTPSPNGAFVRTYSNIVNGTQFELTPEDVQPTSDRGYILLGITQAPQASNGVGVSWLVKTDASGTAQWQEELGCFGTPPGGYADGVSVQQTSDRGYIVGGGRAAADRVPPVRRRAQSNARSSKSWTQPDA